ncbi:SURF1 family protein [Hyphomicrobium methylovorum]|uniref:SURF1 family protein n=1 Tax=Hyphomicrobium methylovorum TaxID=84 RepID=UPI0015E6A823|nr:SURF1 family protein [Hyphomicrobium methylovorum]MBA2125832.1 SURF1 family protein [Hyphomicrobium methylovorum]
MFARWRAAGLILPAILTIVTLPVLIGLGNWQWHRLAWKEDLIAKVKERSVAEPVSYPEALSRYVKTGDVEYLHVRISGTFDNSQEHHLYAPKTSSQGWHVYTLLRPAGGLPPVFVNRGWVSDDLKDPAKRAEGQIEGPVTVTGLVRLPEHRGWFAIDPDYAANRWYWRDLEAMRWGAKGPPSPLQFSAEKVQAYAPFSIDADATPENPGGWPKGGTTEVNISNPHLQYVVTWFAFAVILAAIFTVFARQRLQALDSRKPEV